MQLSFFIETIISTFLTIPASKGQAQVIRGGRMKLKILDFSKEDEEEETEEAASDI